MPERIATCCHFGRRAMLRVADHCLSCGSCGAPLVSMKPLRPTRAAAAANRAPNPHPVKAERPGRKKTPRKPLWRKALEDVRDGIEDVFD